MGKGGIVRDPELHRAACDRVRALRRSAWLSTLPLSKARSSGRKATANFFFMPDAQVRSHLKRWQTVGILAKPRSDREAARIVPELIAWLKQRGVKARLDEETAAYARPSRRHARATESPTARNC